jgi:EAL domain-containing protein (putative c-di-GMP-specific phosphodiesterase class I)/GGDEF domain-containing protein/predicted transcriptional regulator
MACMEAAYVEVLKLQKYITESNHENITAQTEIDNNHLAKHLSEILNNRQITTVFQPIVSLRDGSVFAYEALSRGPLGSPLHTPDKLFAAAEKQKKNWELEQLCRTTAIETISKLAQGVLMFLNVNPLIMHDRKFRQGFTREYLRTYDINPENIVFEITEKGSVDSVQDFIKTVNHYKNQSYRIAIDDAGAGYSGLNMISNVHPHFLKLDMNLVRNIHQDTTRQALLKSLSEFASLTNTHLIAEGIETKEELLKLIDIGIHYGQGFYLQRPQPQLPPLREDLIAIIRNENNKKNHLFYKKSSDLYIRNISNAQQTLSPDIRVLQVYELMKNELSSPGYCITEHGRVIGVVTRNDLFRHLTGQYGYALYAQKPVKEIMRTDFLKVEDTESIKTVSRKAMSRPYEYLYDFISVVTSPNKEYYGIVTVKDLLEKTIEAEINTAKHLNPLSELPGNLLIEKKIQECLDSCSGCSILYFDIDNFKAYNDVYGFENGDKLLRAFVRILQKNVNGDGDFIGHIGGDDFMAMVDNDKAEKICIRLIGDFDREIRKFYNQNDLARGYITCKNRHGNEENFPLMSISIVIVNSKNYKTAHHMSEDIARLKRECKQLIGSNFVSGY